MSWKIDTRFEEAIREASGIIAVSLERLLENKHLYQNMQVDFSSLMPLIDSYGQRVGPALSTERIEAEKQLFSLIPWDPEGNRVKAPVAPGGASGFLAIPFRLPTVRLLCRTCKDTEPYNLVSATDLPAQPQDPRAPTPTIQTFLFALMCQGCKHCPEFFLVRRDGLKVSVTGRSPMEQVAVPKVIPKSVASYYSDAVLAFNSGQVLPALFMLRVLIEQFARAFSQPGQLADQVIDSYMQALPADFKDRFPSLRRLYEDLSARLHDANADSELFCRVRADLEEHFDARRLFHLDGAAGG